MSTYRKCVSIYNNNATMTRFIKKMFFVLTLLSGISTAAFSQSDLVSWKIASEATGDKTFDIKITASIAPGWHMYDMGPYENGPNATTFIFTLPKLSLIHI